MPQMPEEAVWRFKMIDGWRIPYRALFSDQAESIWAALLPEIKFNKERHDALVKMNVQSNFNYVPDTTQMQRVIQELSDGIRS